MTLQDIINRVDTDKINAYGEEQKTSWINTINMNAHVHVLHLPKEDYSPLRYPQDADKELLIEDTYSEVYDYFLYAKIDLLNNEIVNYNNSISLYNAAWGEYAKYMIRQGHLSPKVKITNIE